MKRTIFSACGVCAFIAVFTALALFGLNAAPATAQDALTVKVQVSPHTIVMSNVDGSVTVHANIAYTAVATETVMLEGLTPYNTRPDVEGKLVAKFRLDEVQAIVAPPSTKLTLTGETTEGVAFSGSDVVNVRQL
ncbi:MAG TPA: hypothetical protein VM118_11780 [Acidobacteriota bacterium]|nr:hypothetical protein [Acidobacteriota bacterium]